MTRKQTLATLILVAASLLLAAATVHARRTPEQKCQKGRYDAAAKYAFCHQKAGAKCYGGGGCGKYEAAIFKCSVKYAATWPRLRKRASGTFSTCDAARFLDDGSTVTDKLTGLQWEKKRNLDTIENLADPHDADNRYTWAATFLGTEADGTTFTAFLPMLNGSCFAGQCDWRLPTLAELLTIFEPGRGTCGGGVGPCIDPIFGATGFYHSTATTDTSDPAQSWTVDFLAGSTGTGYNFFAGYARAVRAGL